MSTMRISGLASGMDIDQMVKDLMKAERMPLDKLTQKKQTLEWQRDDYRSMNALLQDLDNYIFSNLTLQSSMLKKKVTSSNDSVVTATASASAANVSMNINVAKIATSATWISTGTENFAQGARTLSLNVTNGDGSTKAVTLSIDASDTLDTVLAKLNNHNDLGITAFYDSVQDKVVITKKDTGAAASLVLNDADTAAFFQQLGFSDAVAGAELTGKTAGQDAQFTINGLTTTRPSNTFTLGNVTYTLKAAGSATIATANDTDAIFNAIKGFVDKYNDTISKINAKLSEQRYRDYLPLTDEQKEAMTEKQVELWEEKAKSGLLRGDTILSSGLNQMRIGVYSKVNDPAINPDYDTLSEIGITTSTNYLENGKLVLDETKLRAAIEKDPNSIYQLFNANGSTFDTKGIARRLRDTIQDTIGKIEQKAGKTLWTNDQFSIGRNLDDLNKQIAAFNDRLQQIEDRYYRQFTAMEEAINRANQQSAYLMNAFGGSQ
ncbi:flagellar hook-associated protein 2 [Anoxybacillus sp. PDR2]|uniref:flagellar hook-associated protein 2 n=1 Tax=Anoxybacillus sp. PDR2 TaxID=1636720 RepID=UPI0013195557|nr:flagellar hook-associated protein 2 [Anoxybacillus sp. PDR2]QHC05385.1 flagellar hook-associated protein 2 [Anoxybacillus sp. PDR2]